MSAMRNAIAGDCYNQRHSDQCGWSKEVDSPVVGRYLSLENHALQRAVSAIFCTSTSIAVLWVGGWYLSLRLHRPAEDAVLAAREPLLKHLLASQLVAPQGRGGVAPIGVTVEVDIESGVAVGHCRAAQRRPFLCSV